MVKFFRKSIIFFAALGLSFAAVDALAQTFTINPDDGIIDPAWGAYSSILADNSQPGAFVEAGESGDILGAKFVAEMPDPSKIYFQVRGSDILDVVSMKLDCDGDEAFDSIHDRQMYFIDISDLGEGGPVEGELDYTEEFLNESTDDELSVDFSSFAIGEYIVEEINGVEGTYLQNLEAVYDLESDSSGALASCFGPAMDNSWEIYYQFDSGAEHTFIEPLQVQVTAVTLSQQSAEVNPPSIFAILIFALLLSMTISLLYVYSYYKRKNI